MMEIENQIRYAPRTVGLMEIEHLIRYTPRAVGLMEIENLFRSTALAVGLKPSAMECKARLRGLYRIISSKTITLNYSPPTSGAEDRTSGAADRFVRAVRCKDSPQFRVVP